MEGINFFESIFNENQEKRPYAGELLLHDYLMCEEVEKFI